mgnify:FL=1
MRQVNPLSDEQYITKLVLREDDLLNNKYTIKTMQELVSIYTSLIEYYDGIKDPIKTYFMEKIQILLSNKEAMEVLEKTTPSDAVTAFYENPPISMNLKKELRSKKVDFNLKVKRNDTDEQRKSINDIMEKHKTANDNITSHIKKEIQSQEDEFSKRMAQRRERSINRSMNRSSDLKPRLGGGLDKDEDTKEILKNLDLGDKKKNKMDNPFEK